MRVIKTEFEPPANDQQTADFIGKLGEMKNQTDKINADIDAEIRKLERRRNRQLRPLTKQIRALLKMSCDYLEQNRIRLLQKERGKTAHLDTGEASWKFKSVLKFRDEQAVVKRLEKKGLHEFITKKVDKHALLTKMLDGIIKIWGVQVKRNEDLYIHPNQTPPKFHYKRSELPNIDIETPHPMLPPIE